MTSREILNRRGRRISWVVYVGFVLFMCGVCAAMIWGQAGNTPSAVAAIAFSGFGVMAVGMMWASRVGLRCPSCRGNVSSIVLDGGGFTVGSAVRYCPYCGRLLDEELNGADVAHQAAEPPAAPDRRGV
jgi:hypothetical protein